jgi:methyl-accepting chemotaxis protein
LACHIFRCLSPIRVISHPVLIFAKEIHGAVDLKRIRITISLLVLDPVWDQAPLFYSKETALLKRLNLLKKFIIGFALILVLLVALAIVGYRGLSGVVEHTRVSDSVNAIGTRLNRARLYEQEFIIGRSDDAVKMVRQTLEAMRDDIVRVETADRDEAIRNQLSAIRSRMADYEQAFDAYVTLVGAQSEKAAQMSEKARFALDLASRIRDREQTQLEEIRQNSETIIARKTALVDASAQVYNTALEARVNRVSLMDNNTLSTMAQWKGANKKLEGEVVQLQSQLQAPENVKMAAQILERQKKYIEDVLGYLDTLQYEDLNRLIKSVKDYTWSITSLQFELRQQLDFFREDTQFLIDEKLAVTRIVTTMANLLMDARLREKEIVADRDTSIAGDVTEKMKAIHAAEALLKEQVDNEDIHGQITPIVAAATEYEAAFKETVDLIDRQRLAESKMVAAAGDVDKVCTAARADQQAKAERQITRSNLLMLAGTLVAIAMGILCAIWCAMVVVRPVRQTAEMLKDIAQGDGDLTGRLAVASKDEIGQMAGWFNAFISKLHDIVRNISEYFETVSASANQLLVISRQMDDGVRDMGDKSGAVAGAADEMSQNMNSVAAASEQASTNVGLVATAMDSMNQTVSAIGESSEKARAVTSRAVAEARQASSKVDRLGNAATEISKVTQVITDISDQTNLLALNATIEAARAGEAGKGFAVVANEIKDLARQTAEATKGIKLEIEGIQSSTAETVSDISRIGDVIGEVDDLVSGIAAAVEEQAATTTSIAENVMQASAGIAEVNANVAQSCAASAEIAADIAAVSRIAGTLADHSSRVSTNAGDLSGLADDLKAMIGEFKVKRTDDAGTAISSGNAELISWDDSIRFDIDTIDQQHHRLVDLINTLYGAMRKRAGKSVLGPILDELSQYTVQHFKEEERLMAEAGYAELDGHQRVHEKLVAQVLDFKQQFEAGSATVTLDLMNFLSDWLVNHIKGVDRKYVSTLKSERLG